LILSLASAIFLADMKGKAMLVTGPKMSKSEILATMIALKIFIRLGTTITGGSQLEAHHGAKISIYDHH